MEEEASMVVIGEGQEEEEFPSVREERERSNTQSTNASSTAAMELASWREKLGDCHATGAVCRDLIESHLEGEPFRDIIREAASLRVSALAQKLNDHHLLHKQEQRLLKANEATNKQGGEGADSADNNDSNAGQREGGRSGEADDKQQPRRQRTLPAANASELIRSVSLKEEGGLKGALQRASTIIHQTTLKGAIM